MSGQPCGCDPEANDHLCEIHARARVDEILHANAERLKREGPQVVRGFALGSGDEFDYSTNRRPWRKR